MIAVDEKSKKIKKLALMLKTLDVNVYIYGNKGVGKKYLANFIANENDIITTNLKEIPKNKRVILIGYEKLNESIKENFNITVEIFLDDLINRKKDTLAFIKYFKNEVKQNLKIEEDFEVEIDISENLNSLKKSIYKSALCYNLNKNNIIEILEKYFDKNYIDSSYNEELKIFDSAIIKSLQKKYKSKLQMAKHLKINRATLSKKVDEIGLN